MKTFPVTYYEPGIWVVLLHFSSCNIQKKNPKKPPASLLMSAQENVGMSRDKQKTKTNNNNKNKTFHKALALT